MLENKAKSMIKLNAATAIAPILVAGGVFYVYKDLKDAVHAQNEKQNLLLLAMEKQGLPGKLLKIVDDKLGKTVPSEIKVQVANTILMICSAKNIPVHIACGLIEVESGWNVNALSGCGAKGLTQIMPGTAKPYLRNERKSDSSDELFNPVTSVIVGLSYLSDLHSQYVELGVTEPNNYTFALHSYFWGGNNSAILLGKKDGRVNVPNFSYPLRVMAVAKQYKDLGL